MELKDFYNEMLSKGININDFDNYLRLIKLLKNFRDNFNNSIKCFLLKSTKYNNFISYLIINDKLHILVKNDKGHTFLLDVVDNEIYKAKIYLDSDYEAGHLTDILKGKRLDKIKAEAFIKKHIDNNVSKSIKDVNYVDDIRSIYYRQNRLLIYAEWIGSGCRLNCDISKKAQFKCLVPLDIKYDNEKNRYKIRIKTIFMVDKNQFSIMI